MRLLLDTHALVWFLAGDERLSAPARRAISNAGNVALASAVSAYELAQKHRRGQIDFPFIDELADAVRRARLEPISVTVDHALAAGMLPGPHRDPWDRILMAQASQERCSVVTCDPVFVTYGLRTLW